jgi:hypothetical protein
MFKARLLGLELSYGVQIHSLESVLSNWLQLGRILLCKLLYDNLYSSQISDLTMLIPVLLRRY